MSPVIPASELPQRPSWLTRRTVWVGIAVGAIAISFYQAGVGQPDTPLVNWGGWGQFAEFWQAALTPDLSGEFLRVMVRATGVTLAYAVCGTTLSLVLGSVGGLLLSETWWRSVFPAAGAERRLGAPIWLTLRGLLAVPRAIHELIWGLFFLNIFGLDPLVAILAIAIPFGAIVAKVFAEILDETPPAPLQALLGSGVPPLTAWFYSLLPQALPNLLSYASYRFECSLRSAAVLGVIGAGGLGYEILLSLQSLRYDQLWTGFYALVVLNGAVDVWSGWLRRSLGFTNRLALSTAGQSAQRERDRPTPAANQPRRWGLRLSGLGLALAIPFSFGLLDIEWQRLWADSSWALLVDIVIAARPTWPDWETWQPLWQLSSVTVMMAIVAIAIAGFTSLLASFPAAQTMLLPGGWLRPLDSPSRLAPLAWLGLIGTRLMLLISRAVPAPIWALVFLFVLFPGILPGALALAVHNFGILGRLMAEVNENLDDRPVRSLYALGASAPQVIAYSILPQNLGQFVAYTLYRWEVCMRETVIVGLVGAGGLGRLMTEQLSSFDYSGLVLTLGCFVVLTFGVDLVSQQMRASLRG